MTEYGIKVINPTTGSIQLDENFANLELLEIRTITTQPNPATSNFHGANFYKTGFSYFTIFTVPGGGGTYPIPLEVFFISSYYIHRRGTFIETTGAPMHYAVHAAPGSTLTAYIFGRPNQSFITGDDYGIVSKNAAGDILFHSNRQYLNLVGVYTGSNYTTGLPSATLPSGRTYAFAPISRTGRFRINEGNPFPGGRLYEYRFREEGLMVRMSGNVLQGENVAWMDAYNSYLRVYFGNGYRADQTVLPWVVLVADVTYFVNPTP